MKPCPICRKGVEIKTHKGVGSWVVVVIHKTPSLCGGTIGFDRAVSDEQFVPGTKHELAREWARGS